MEREHTKNAERFHGYAEVYENARPAVPKYPVEIVCRYLKHTPARVVDLGCGTGLSTTVWRSVCGDVIGVEPSGDMLAVARGKEQPGLRFIQAFSDDTGIESETAEVVVCSQSFHWMEPGSTLKEVNRILKGGGIFATVDVDWPPVVGWELEREYMDIYAKIKRLEGDLDEIRSTFVRYPKERHLENISQNGHFRYVRELTFANREECTAERFIGILLSQGNLQMILKKRPELIEQDVERFRQRVDALAGDGSFAMDFSYRMRIGVK
ncbi:MAG: class I SAM-dependent methyltransferase [Oscillospiraceae bacterium]|jgi:ubiquinone/menaquinone biosynthesis C-methylase UbiE